MRPGLNLAISTIRAWNNIGVAPRIVAPENATRTQIVFHNPGFVDILVAPVVVVHDPDAPQSIPSSGVPAAQLKWPHDWPFDPVDPVALVVSQLIPPRSTRPIDTPPIPVSNRPLHPRPNRRGGCLQVYANGGERILSGNVTMAWQAFALDQPISCDSGGGLTVVGPTPPSAPMTGQLWWDTGDVSAGGGQLYVWTGTEWVAASCCNTGGSTTPPPSPGPSLPPPGGHPLTVIELT